MIGRPRKALAVLLATALFQAVTPWAGGMRMERITPAPAPRSPHPPPAVSSVSPTKKPPQPRNAKRASRATYRTPAHARILTIHLAHKANLTGPQVACLLTLWTRESNFRPQALNRRTGAGGIPQILGLNPATPTRRQIERGLAYIAHRYGTPCTALHHHDRRGWY